MEPSAPTVPAAPRLPSAFTLFGPSTQALKLNFGTFAGLFFVPLVPPVICAVLLSITLFTGTHSIPTPVTIALTLLEILAVAAFLILSIMATAGYFAAQLKSVRGEKTTIRSSLQTGRHFAWRYLGLGICVGLLTLGGLLLLIVPGLFMIRRYYLAPYYLIDRDLGVFEAMRQSAAASKRFSRAIWGLLGVMFLISLPAIVPILGWIANAVLALMYFCAPAVRYQQMQHLDEQPVNAPVSTQYQAPPAHA